MVQIKADFGPKLGKLESNVKMNKTKMGETQFRKI